MIPTLRRLSARHAATPPLRLSLALQGGGAHGAFTWGVLERLLEEDTLAIDAVSGTSAGAANAVALAWGWCRGGRAGARDLLAQLWHAIGRAGRSQAAFPRGGIGALALDLATHLFSPYQLNPLGIDPLRQLLANLVDFAALRRNAPMKLLIAATHVLGAGPLTRQRPTRPTPRARRGPMPTRKAPDNRWRSGAARGGRRAGAGLIFAPPSGLQLSTPAPDQGRGVVRLGGLEADRAASALRRPSGCRLGASDKGGDPAEAWILAGRTGDNCSAG
jgi:hypothetical protein